MSVHLLGYPMVLCLSLLAGSWLGIRGYRRRQVQKLIHAVREAVQEPRRATIAYVCDTEGQLGVLKPLTGSDMAESDRPVA